MVTQKICDHLSAVKEVKTAAEYVCEECIKAGGTWVHLRTCQTCGITLCCDSSPNKHMTNHYYATQHPLAASAEPGERWLYCYADQIFAKY